MTRSGKNVTPVDRLIPVMSAEILADTQNDIEGEIFCMQAMYPGGTEQDGIHPLLAYKSTSDPDTMYLHEAMKQPDKVEFLKAMDKEVKDQRENGNFSLIKKTELPKDAMVLPVV